MCVHNLHYTLSRCLPGCMSLQSILKLLNKKIDLFQAYCVFFIMDLPHVTFRPVDTMGIPLSPVDCYKIGNTLSVYFMESSIFCCRCIHNGHDLSCYYFRLSLLWNRNFVVSVTVCSIVLSTPFRYTPKYRLSNRRYYLH